MSLELNDLLGRWVQVWTGSGAGFAALPHLMAGILEDMDDFAIYLRHPNGETLCVPRGAIRQLVPMVPPEDLPVGFLLRPSEKPADSDTLLRPAGSGSIESDLLVRAAGESEEET